MKETKFKQTEVGMIPNDWETKPLEHVTVNIGDGIHTTPEYSDSGTFFFINGNNVKQGKLVLSEETKKVSKENAQRYTFPISNNTLFMSINGTIGNVAFYNNESVVLGKSVAYLTANKKIDKFYLFHVLQSKQIQEQFKNILTGSTIQNLGLTTIRTTNIPLPPTVEEQKRIAQALSDVDAVISTTEKLIAKKKALKQGTMQTLLSGKMRIQNGKWIKTTNFKQTELGPIPQEWEVKSLGSITQNSSYGVGAEAIPFNGKAKYIRITDIDDDSHRFEPSPLTSPAFYENKHLVQENDLLIARTGASVGKTYLYNAKDGKLVFAGFLIKMNICGADSKFVFYSTLTKYYQDWIVSESARTGQPGVNLQQMKKLLIAIPSSMAEQTAIATVLSDMDSEIAALETKLAKYRQLKTGMMQQLLTGKVRLV